MDLGDKHEQSHGNLFVLAYGNNNDGHTCPFDGINISYGQ